MATPDKQQIGDGQDNISGAAQQAGELASKAGKQAAETAARAGTEAASNAAAASVTAAETGGSAAAGVASGTAAGGAIGAAIALAWNMRHTIFKILVTICMFLLLFIVLITSLPSIVWNNIFGLEPDNIDFPGMDMYGITDALADTVNQCIQNGYDIALDSVEDIINDGDYDYEASMDALINNATATPDYDVCYVLAAYSASMQQRGTRESDMRNKLNSVAGQMYEVTFVEKEFERVIPLEYPTYSRVDVEVITGKTQTGTVGGVPQYSYTTGTRSYYSKTGTEVTEETVTRLGYSSVSVEVPVRTGGTVTGSTYATYYERGGTETLVPDTETIVYAEITIHPFNVEVILDAFGIDKEAQYGDFNTTYGEAITTMAYAMKMTLYGFWGSGDVPIITDEDMLAILEALDCSQIRKDIIACGLSLVGRVPYFWAGKSGPGWNDEWNTPRVVSGSGSTSTGETRPYGLDCSGFTDWCYKTAGLPTIGVNSTDQWHNSTPISASELQPGDLGFLAQPGEAGINHVLLYVGMREDGRILWLHCASGLGVCLNSPDYVKYYRRIPGLI